uniref:28S ribosomal protein S18b, mitochondrial n=1 Tax=Panagrolaimus sp. PS1159 TaxID=55785 RepID=A0AC35GSQ4_9BILA
MNRFQALLPSLHQTSRNSLRLYATQTAQEIAEIKGLAYNEVERKKGLYKPEHTLEEQVNYMKSQVYHNAYKGLPIHKWYRRNLKGQEAIAPPPRMFCIDKEGKFNVNHACPVCRDEYLFFDYRNPDLIKQFLEPGTDSPLDIHKTGLCREQYKLLQAQLLKAKEHGTLPFAIEFRWFNYKTYYPNWKGTGEFDVEEIPSRLKSDIYESYPDPLIEFPTHNRDVGNNWDEWWKRHGEFARKAK